jgi:O-glycosyl hydrolase
MTGVLTLPWICGIVLAQTVSIDSSVRHQAIDGFGTCLYGNEGLQSWWQDLYFNDLQCSILRMDLSPAFRAPYTGMNGTYNSPWYHNNPPLPGPENNNVRAYTNAADYTSSYNGWRAPIAVMGPNIDQNTNFFDFGATRVAGTLAKIGAGKSTQPGSFKLIGSIWSPAPWVKVASGNLYPNNSQTPMPVGGTPWPFIWYNNFAGGKLDTSGALISEFNDSPQGGTGPTSALTQFARCTAAYLRGFQKTYGVQFYSISIQNELNFEEFYGSCTYPLSVGYLAALKAVRAELDKYPDLAPIRIMGPEDLLGGDIWGLWQYGGGGSTIHKNLQYLQNMAADSTAAAAEAFFCIHGYASDGVSAANATPTLWNWWANGWTSSPTPGIPSNVKGFTYYGKKSWMTETSGENPAWLNPADSYPSDGAWGLALRIHQALTTGRQSAWIYWQMTDGNAVAASTLTSAALTSTSPKYVAAKHFFRHIRPDSVRVNATVAGSTNLLASAFVHDANRTLTVVLINSSANPLSASVNLPPQPASVGSFRTFTSSNGSYWQSGATGITNGQALVSMPGYSVATLYGVAPPVLNARLTSPTNLSLTWTQALAAFALQSTPALTLPVNWTTDTNTVAVTNGTATVKATINPQPRFFRLIWQ